MLFRSFSSPESDRGAIWKYIRVKKLPRKTIDRLKQITTKDLNEKLGVVAQFEFTEDKIFSVYPSKNLNPRKGVRKSGNTIQFGLTSYEIKAVKKKIDYIFSQKTSTLRFLQKCYENQCETHISKS